MSKSVFAAVVMAIFAAPAYAATYTFNFMNIGSNHDSVYVGSNEDPDFKVKVEGFYYDLVAGSYVAGSSIDVDSNSYGLISDNSDPDSHTIDSWGSDESMKFTFEDGKEVTLTSIVISWYYGTGDYDLFADGAHVGHTSEGDVLPAGPANMFAIGTRSIAYTTYCHSYYSYSYYECTKYYESGIKIKSITVEHDPNGGIIPLPATGLLLLGAIGGFGVMRRRKS